MVALFPRWPTDRLLREENWRAARHAPLVTYEKAQNALRLAAVTVEAEAAGLFRGQALADARALCSEIVVASARSEDDAQAFETVCAWLMRYSPSVFPSSVGEVFLDIAGCQTLFGGEENMIRDVKRRLDGAGFACRAAIADTPGAAWAVAAYGAHDVIPVGEARKALQPLPVEALRVAPEIADTLRRLGVKTIGALLNAPRAALASRFPASLLDRLDQAMGDRSESFPAFTPPPAHYADLRLAEPVVSVVAVMQCIEKLCTDLFIRLEKAGQGGRIFELSLFHVDNRMSRLQVRASRASADPRHIGRLFADRIERLETLDDAGFGYEQFRLAAIETQPLRPAPRVLFARGAGEACVAALRDRLRARLGEAGVRRFVFADSHAPERAEQLGGDEETGAMRATPANLPARPLRILDRPEEVKVLAVVPDGPPLRFRWRRVSYRVVRANGPERLAPEWWSESGTPLTRDYYCVEDECGRRYWIYRDGLYGRETAQPKWRLHGFFP